MKKFTLLLALGLLASPTIEASPSDITCGGINTVLISSQGHAVTVCHGPYMKIKKGALTNWNECTDAMILYRESEKGGSSLIADCTADNQKQFSVKSNLLKLRHFYTVYPGFDAKPLMIEVFDTNTKIRKFRFEKKFSKCSDGRIRKLDTLVRDVTSKPKNNTFFNKIYGAFFELRDCSFSNPDKVIDILKGYRKLDDVDGEVAETLSTAIEEAELIRLAKSGMRNH